MSFSSLYRISGIILLLGVIVNFLAAIWTFFVNPSLEAPLSELQSPQWVVVYALAFVASSLILLGLPGFYLRQSGGRGGKLALVGVVLYAAGLLMGNAITGYFVSVVPLLAKKAPDIISDSFYSNFAVFPLGSFFLSLIGLILLGIAIARAKVFPSYVGALLIISGITNVLGIFFNSETASFVINLITALSLGIALGVAGLKLVSSKEQQVNG